MLKNVLKWSCLDSDIKEFDNGLEKEVKEGCCNFSGGQKARINLARCFYEDADIMLLDSPFNALDFSTASKILNHMMSSDFKEKTILMTIQNI